MRCYSSSWARPSSLVRTTYFLTAITFPTTNHLHRSLTATEIQKLPSFSMTGATRAVAFDFAQRYIAARLRTRNHAVDALEVFNPCYEDCAVMDSTVGLPEAARSSSTLAMTRESPASHSADSF